METKIPKWLVQGLGGLLIALVALLVIDKAHSLSDTFKNKNPKNTISVSAEGKVAAIPDLATLTVGVITQGATPQAVQDENNKRISKILDAVKSDGISKEDVVTSQFNLFPEHNYNNGKDTITGYQANQTLTIKVRDINKSTEKLSKVMGDATDNGSNQIYGVSLGFDKPDDLRQQARKLAIENAKEKAKDLAQTAGLSLGRVVSLSESGGATPGPIPYAADSAMGMGSAEPNAVSKSVPTPIEPGSQDITAEMTVVYELR